MTDPLPSNDLKIPMEAVLNNENKFIHSLDACHDFVTIEKTINDLKIKLYDDIIIKASKDISKTRHDMFDKFGKGMKEAEKAHMSFLDSFSGIYPNSDVMESSIKSDQLKIKNVEEKYKQAKELSEKYYKQTDPNVRNQIDVTYKAALNTFKTTQESTTNELKKSDLERMEKTVVSFIPNDSYCLNTGLTEKCNIVRKQWKCFINYKRT